MINRNEADYTNFDGKTNKRIVQAPGGASSLSLGWGDAPTDYGNNQRTTNQRNNFQAQQAFDYNKKSNPIQQQKQESYEEPMRVMNNNYDKGPSYQKNSYEDQNNKQNYGTNYNNEGNKNSIGGQYGYNNYNNPITQGNSYQNYPQSNKYPTKNEPTYYEEKSDPNSFYKPSSSNNYKNPPVQQFDYALQQQKSKIQSSRSNRNQNQRNQGVNHSSHQSQQTGYTRPCVKIQPQRNNDIFGNEYNYWKQDGHNTGSNSGQNTKKDNQYLYEKNNQYDNRTKQNEVQNQYNGNSKNQKTTVKVHNPPGGKSNFIFG